MSRSRGQHRNSRVGLAEKRAHITYDYMEDTTFVLVDGVCVGAFPGFHLESRAKALDTLLQHEPPLPPDDYQKSWRSGDFLPDPIGDHGEAQFASPWDSNEAAERQLAYQAYKAEEHFGQYRGPENSKPNGLQEPEDEWELHLDL